MPESLSSSEMLDASSIDSSAYMPARLIQMRVSACPPYRGCSCCCYCAAGVERPVLEGVFASETPATTRPIAAKSKIESWREAS